MSAAPAKRRGSSSSSRRWVWVAGAVVVVLAAVWLMRSRSAAGRGFDTSGNPRAGRGESGAQEPSGGAAGIPDNMPGKLVITPDQLQQQVQQSDTTSGESPGAIHTGPYGEPPGGIGPAPSPIGPPPGGIAPIQPPVGPPPGGVGGPPPGPVQPPGGWHLYP